MPSPGVGVGVRVCLARQLWALSLGSHRRAVFQIGGGGVWRAAGLYACRLVVVKLGRLS